MRLDFCLVRSYTSCWVGLERRSPCPTLTLILEEAERVMLSLPETKSMSMRKGVPNQIYHNMVIVQEKG